MTRSSRIIALLGALTALGSAQGCMIADDGSSAQSVSAPLCSGTPIPCSAMSVGQCRSSFDCREVGDCKGNADPCNSFTEAECTGEWGCEWNSYARACRGSSSCWEIDSAWMCTTRRGCTWHASCEGYRTPCELLDPDSCSFAPGCSSSNACPLHMQNALCDACVGSNCCQELSACADDTDCGRLRACAGQNCLDATDFGACLQSACAEFVTATRELETLRSCIALRCESSCSLELSRKLL